MPVLTTSTVDECFSDAMSIAANGATSTSLGTAPTFSLGATTNTDDVFMSSLLSDDIWNKFGLDSSTDLFNFDLKELLDDENAAAMVEMGLFNETASSCCGNESDSSNSSLWPSWNFDDLFEIRNHDCMWAGHCGSKEHPTDEQPSVRAITAPIIAARQSIQKSLRCDTSPAASVSAKVTPVQVPAGRSVLLKSVKQNQQTAGQNNSGGFSPDTPPMSDDEEIKAKTSPPPPPPPPPVPQETATSTLQILQSVIDDYDIKVDNDLCDYLADEDLLKQSAELIKQEIDESEETDDGLPDEEEEEEEAMAHEEKRNHQQQQRCSSASFNQFPSDHCYHKGTSLSYETPSDSDDEIDVVSIPPSEPLTAPQPAAHSPARYPRGHLSYHQLQQLQQQHKRNSNLPYNPTTRDRHQLQRTVATAMSNKKMVNNGQQYIRAEQTSSYPRVKTLLPLHRNTQAQTSNAPPPRRTYNQQATSLQHGGKRKQPATMNKCYTPQSAKYTRKRANYHNSSDSEPEPSEKRSLHNNMERQRRIDLRNAFEHLRVLVPEVNKRERAAKVVILREARIYCNRLTTVDEDNQMQIEELKEHQERLRARVSQLRRSLATKHR